MFDPLSPLTQNTAKNFVTKCVGLSPVLFFFAIAGNATYVASILVVSTEAKYFTVNASWLAGTSYIPNTIHNYVTLVQVADWSFSWTSLCVSTLLQSLRGY